MFPMKKLTIMLIGESVPAASTSRQMWAARALDRAPSRWFRRHEALILAMHCEVVPDRDRGLIPRATDAQRVFQSETAAPRGAEALSVERPGYALRSRAGMRCTLTHR